MSVIHRIRACAVGSHADMIRLNRVLLRNCDYLEEPDDRPPYTLRELREQLAEHMQEETGNAGGFLYQMISPHHYGETIGATFYELQQLDADLWTAEFSYESIFRLQQEDWLRLHKECDRLPIFIIHATNDFSLDKGMVILSNGEIIEDWDHMGEIWYRLFHEFGKGTDPDSALEEMEKLQAIMTQEDWDQSVRELLESCIDLLEESLRARSLIDSASIQQALDSRKFHRIFTMHRLLAMSVLEDIRHAPVYLACLRQNLAIWNAAHPQEDLTEEQTASST